jgi:hypothetical protein
MKTKHEALSININQREFSIDVFSNNVVQFFMVDDVDGDVVFITFNKEQIQQIVDFLLKNVIKE